MLVAGREDRALSEAGEAFGALHCMAGGRHPGVDQNAVGKYDCELNPL